MVFRMLFELYVRISHNQVTKRFFFFKSTTYVHTIQYDIYFLMAWIMHCLSAPQLIFVGKGILLVRLVGCGFDSASQIT